MLLQRRPFVSLFLTLTSAAANTLKDDPACALRVKLSGPPNPLDDELRQLHVSDVPPPPVPAALHVTPVDLRPSCCADIRHISGRYEVKNGQRHPLMAACTFQSAEAKCYLKSLALTLTCATALRNREAGICCIVIAPHWSSGGVSAGAKPLGGGAVPSPLVWPFFFFTARTSLEIFNDSHRLSVDPTDGCMSE